MATKKTRIGGTETLLVELLTEELPPKTLRALSDAFGATLAEDLRQDDFLEPESQVRVFATPRRLAVQITRVREQAPDKPIELSGPSVKVGLDASGNPTPALLGFARKYGVDVAKLARRQTPKGEFFFHRDLAKGGHLDTNLELKIQAALSNLPVSKIMRWGNGDTEFVRPAHGLVMLHGSKVVPGKVLGLESTNQTLGHRFLSIAPIELKHADDYERVLRGKGNVIASFAARRDNISKQLADAAGGDAALVADDALLDEIAALVEAPAVYAGAFSIEFLAVPEECLILSMQQHQKYVPLRDKVNGNLLPRFLFVANLSVKDPARIVHGNERVLRARLADAKFFYDQDRKVRLEERVPHLAKVVYFRDKLGSQLDRVRRIEILAAAIARALAKNVSLVERAARLAKADLLTEMVGEFPELQGVMGRYYAKHDGEEDDVAEAIAEHYRPRFAGDALPKTDTGTIVALADKLELVVGMFGVGQQPTGDKDPYALRRNALGVVRILIEKKLDLGILPLVDLAIGVVPEHAKSDWLPIVEFILDRARSYFSDCGYASTAIEAVLQPFGRSSWLHTLPDTVAEASRFIATEEGKILAEANKRITNILKKSGYEVPFGLAPDALKQKPNSELFRDGAELAFWDALQRIGAESLALKRQKRFAESLRLLSQLGTPTKSFFDNVMVNVEDVDVRDNRITLLQHARAYMNQVADLSLMAS